MTFGSVNFPCVNQEANNQVQGHIYLETGIHGCESTKIGSRGLIVRKASKNGLVNGITPIRRLNLLKYMGKIQFPSSRSSRLALVICY